MTLGPDEACSVRGLTVDSLLCKGDSDITLQAMASMPVSLVFTPDCTTTLVKQGAHGEC